MTRPDLDLCRIRAFYNDVRRTWFAEVTAPGGRLLKTTRTFPSRAEVVAAAEGWVAERKGAVVQ